jgi:ribosomal protein L19E
MKLENKKEFVAKTLGVGKARIIFNTARLADIKESITRQDVRDLHASGAISLRDVRGRKTIVARKRRRGFGSVRKRPVNTKREYMTLTRKLRAYLAHLKIQGKLPQPIFEKLRKEIRARNFRSLGQMKERMSMAKIGEAK